MSKKSITIQDWLRTVGSPRFGRDLLVLVILVSATAMLIWNGSSFFIRMSITQGEFSPELKLASTTLTLNVALILFGWRRYVDLLHEAERRAESELRAKTLASTDAHTGLLNRVGFADYGLDLLEGIRSEEKERLAVVTFNLHRMRALSDRHGYEFGDNFVRCLAAAFTDAAPRDALLARVSNEEVVAAFPVSEEDFPAGLTNAASAMLRALGAPIELDGKVIQLGVSCGIAVSSPDKVSDDMASLLRRADIAMNHAVAGRSARPVWFDAAMEQALLVQGEMEQGIRHALEHDQFVPYFEPQIDLRTGELVGFEVLARWNHPLTGTISPDRFIPIAEDLGLIDRLSEQVAVKAMVAALDWPKHLTMSINITPAQLNDSWLAQKIVRWLGETGFPASRLTVEITESSLFADLELAKTIVASLKRQGIQLALDDFGSGFSSLSHLRALPFDRMKVDHVFVSSLNRDPQNAAIVKAVTTMAHALGVPVTAEGIENAATLNAVLAMGCDVGQGWYLGKPMPASDVEALIRAHERGPEAKPAARQDRLAS